MRSHTSQNKLYTDGVFRAPVAQWIRAPDYGSGGRRFESCRARHFAYGVLLGRRILIFFGSPSTANLHKMGILFFRKPRFNSRDLSVDLQSKDATLLKWDISGIFYERTHMPNFMEKRNVEK